MRDFVYDNLHRLTAENWMSGNTVVAAMNYAYDAANQLLTASDPNSAYAFGYNGDGNVTSVDNNGTPNVPDVVLTGGLRCRWATVTSLSATIAGTADFLNSYSYDADQRLTMRQQQDQNGGNVVSPKEIDYAYNALGQFTSVADLTRSAARAPTWLTGAYSYDTGNRLTGLTYTSNAGATRSTPSAGATTRRTTSPPSPASTARPAMATTRRTSSRRPATRRTAATTSRRTKAIRSTKTATAR